MMVSYFRACLMTMYLPTFIMAKWDSDTLLNTLKAIVAKSVLTQYVPEVFPCSSAIFLEIKKKVGRSLPCKISCRQAGKCNVSVGVQSVLSRNSDYDQCIQNNCKWTGNNAEDGNEDKPAVSLRSSMIESSLRNRWIASTNCAHRICRGWTWIHIFFLAWFS